MSTLALQIAGNRSMTGGNPTLRRLARQKSSRTAKGSVALTRDGVRKHFVRDIPTDEADIVFATQGPLAVKCCGDKISEAAWRSKPSWYIVATHDETIPPDVEARFGETDGCRDPGP